MRVWPAARHVLPLSYGPLRVPQRLGAGRERGPCPETGVELTHQHRRRGIIHRPQAHEHRPCACAHQRILETHRTLYGGGLADRPPATGEADEVGSEPPVFGDLARGEPRVECARHVGCQHESRLERPDLVDQRVPRQMQESDVREGSGRDHAAHRCSAGVGTFEDPGMGEAPPNRRQLLGATREWRPRVRPDLWIVRVADRDDRAATLPGPCAMSRAREQRHRWSESERVLVPIPGTAGIRECAGRTAATEVR